MQFVLYEIYLNYFYVLLKDVYHSKVVQLFLSLCLQNLKQHDLEILETAANRIIEITENGCFDRSGTYEEYAEWRRENVGGTLTI